MDVRVRLWRSLSAEELMLLNCGVGEDSWESLGLQGDPTSPFWRRSALGDFFGRTDAKAETPMLWPSDAKNWLIGKYPDAGKDWRWEEKRMTEDEMFGWHTWRTWVWVGWGSWDGQGGRACCSPGVAKSQTRLSDWNELNTLKPVLGFYLGWIP